MTDVLIDARRGAGSSLEILYGTVTWKPTLTHSRGTSIVLPAPTTYDLVDGQVVATNVQPTPEPVEGQIEWAYEVTFKDRHSKSYSFLVGVPDSTTQVNFTSLPRYFETKPPLFGQGPKGEQGEAATVAVGTVTGGTTAQVNNSGTNTDAVLNFVLPEGPQGPKGDGVTYLEPGSKNFSDEPVTYPNGISYMYLSSVGSTGWPEGFAGVWTYKANSPARTHQRLVANNSIKVLERSSNTSSAWQPFKEVAWTDLATTSANGLMSSADKNKLDNIGILGYNSKRGTDAPSTYPVGTTVLRASQANDWPGESGISSDLVTVVTSKSSSVNGGVSQWLYEYNDPTVAPKYRISRGDDTWGEWNTNASQEWVKENAGQAGVVNVKDYGAVGDGVADDFEAVRNAFEAVKPGGTVFFPTGTYYTAHKLASTPSNWIVLSKDNVTVRGEGEDTYLENFLLAVSGSYGVRKSLSLSVGEGDKSIATTSAHEFSVDSYIQLLSNVNAYSQDAGKWQLGSTNPTNGVRPEVRFTETLQVAKVIDTTSVETYSEVIYDTYKNSNTGLAHPMGGLSTSQVRELFMVKGVTFQDLTFKNVAGASSWRFFVARACANLTFERVNTLSGDLPGAAIKISDSYDVKFIGCEIRKALNTFSGSSWNTVFVGGGCQEVLFQDCKGFGEAQGIDLTPNRFTSASDYGGDTYPAGSMSTIQFMKVDNCSFYGCSDGVTSHPGSYHFMVTNSNFEGGSTGVRARSKQTVIQNNVFNTSAAGVSLSAFVSDSLISDNIITRKRSTKYGVYWFGISYSWASSEIMNENNVDNLVIRDNSIKGDLTNSTSANIRISGTRPTDMPEVTSAVLARASNISIVGNSINDGTVFVGEYVNRVYIEGNRFQGGSSMSHYLITKENSAANRIGPNYFMSISGTGGIQTGLVTNTGHTYGTAHRVSTQEVFGGDISFDLVNTDFVFVKNNKSLLVDGWTGINGSGLSTSRASGAATLAIDAVPSDGTSASTVTVFGASATTGVKTLDVRGRLLAQEQVFPNSRKIVSDAGDPNGSVVAPVGSLYLRTDGGATTSLYVKTSGTGNTGWTAK